MAEQCGIDDMDCTSPSGMPRRIRDMDADGRQHWHPETLDDLTWALRGGLRVFDSDGDVVIGAEEPRDGLTGSQRVCATYLSIPHVDGSADAVDEYVNGGAWVTPSSYYHPDLHNIFIMGTITVPEEEINEALASIREAFGRST